MESLDHLSVAKIPILSIDLYRVRVFFQRSESDVLVEGCIYDQVFFLERCMIGGLLLIVRFYKACRYVGYTTCWWFDCLDSLVLSKLLFVDTYSDQVLLGVHITRRTWTPFCEWWLNNWVILTWRHRIGLTSCQVLVLWSDSKHYHSAHIGPLTIPSQRLEDLDTSWTRHQVTDALGKEATRRTPHSVAGYVRVVVRQSRLSHPTDFGCRHHLPAFFT